MDIKDYFSEQSKAYAAFRPSYPPELYAFIFEHLKGRRAAWDCATGNGQVASFLSKHFDKVFATDISQEQLRNAFPAKNIFYSLSPAEKTKFSDKQFDLITVAQALHWIRQPEFYGEVSRTGLTGGILAVWGYSSPVINGETGKMIGDFYNNTVGPYWDKARKLVEDHYRSIDFPFAEISCPAFYIRLRWSADHLTGYLSSWSATRQYIRINHADPVEPFREQLKSVWKPGELKSVTFPVFMRLGRIE